MSVALTAIASRSWGILIVRYKLSERFQLLLDINYRHMDKCPKKEKVVLKK